MLLANGTPPAAAWPSCSMASAAMPAFMLPARDGFTGLEALDGRSRLAPASSVPARSVVSRSSERRKVQQEMGDEGEQGCCIERRLVARLRHLSGLSALLSGHDRRRHRRPRGHHAAARPYRLARRRCRSGCRPSSSRRWPTWATTCPTIATSIRCSARIEDFDALVAEAHRLGLKVIIDQVLSHSSDQHPWFVESRSSRDNPKADWYVWADAEARRHARPTTGCRSSAGRPGSGIRRAGNTTCTTSSPRSPTSTSTIPEVQDALLETVRFWLERGVDGFRLDTVNYYFHDK